MPARSPASTRPPCRCCAFVQARREAGLGTGFHGCTATFSDAARLLGVTQALGLDVTHDNLKSVENAA